MTVEKPKPKQLLRPITTGADSATNQSQSLEITCNTLKAREKSRLHGAIGFGFASHWLKNWRESFKPITKRSNRNYIITFDNHLKTALKILWNLRWTFIKPESSLYRRFLSVPKSLSYIFSIFNLGKPAPLNSGNRTPFYSPFSLTDKEIDFVKPDVKVLSLPPEPNHTFN